MTQESSNSENLCHVMHGYLEPDKALFAHFHAPQGESRDTGYVICSPLGYEGVHCHHTQRVLADALADAGLPVMRIHYHGTGESLGSDADANRVAAWLTSIDAAAQSLLGLEGVSNVGLIGIRMGATLAAVAATRMRVSNLVLWEPCVSGAMYVREMEILASATAKQLEAEAGAVPEVAGVPEGLQAGGYLITPETKAGLAGIKLEGLVPRGNPRTLLLQRDDRPANTRLAEQLLASGFEVEAEQIPGHKEMMAGSHPMSSVLPQNIVARIQSWAASAGTAQPANKSHPALALETTSQGLRRKVVRLGDNQRLLGIVTEPVGGARPGEPDIVLYSGGVVPRTAVNRMYVMLADKLAGTGRRVLRLDVSGIGESEPAPANQWNEIFPTSLLKDARAALDFMAGGKPNARFWLIGLCSGGATTFQTALANERVVGAVCINPAAFYWTPGTSPDNMDVKQFAEAEYYKQSMFSLDRWLKLFSGRVNILHIGKLLWGRITGSLATRWEQSSLLGLKQPQGLAADLHRLTLRGVDVNLVFSPGDYSYDLLTGLLGNKLPWLEKHGLVAKHFVGADHTFNPFGIRMQLIDWIEARVTASRASQEPESEVSSTAMGEKAA